MKYLKGSFGYDYNFLKEHVDTILLENGDAKLVLSPTLQGRVMTSSADGDDGDSYGWVNYNLIASKQFLPHCNNFGGEDRYWIGPEGGQFSIFFKKNDPFDLEHWQTPAPIDTESWDVDLKEGERVVLSKSMQLKNYHGSVFDVEAKREVELLDCSDIESSLEIKVEKSVRSVGFKSINTMINNGSFDWNKQTGMLSIWVLGQFTPSEEATIILPIEANAEGEIMNDRYFGKIDEERIKVLSNAILFKADGLKRGKIGVGPNRTLPVIGSYDALNKVLTIVKFNFNPEKTDYVNSMWELQEKPFKGDVVNAYNDGPLDDGSIMGPFYELETSSAAANLKPQESIVHEHATFHFKGSENQLAVIAKNLLGVSLNDCNF